MVGPRGGAPCPGHRVGLGGALGSIEGKAAILAFVEEYWTTWEDHHHYAEEVLDLGHGVMFLDSS
jgi:hypothetical protein